MDYYLRTTDKESFVQDLQKVGIEITLDNNYYQDEDLIVDWIGQIPNPIQLDEEGNIIGDITFKEGQHVNMRSLKPINITLFENTQDVYPDIPYRIFS